MRACGGLGVATRTWRSQSQVLGAALVARFLIALGTIELFFKVLIYLLYL